MEPAKRTISLGAFYIGLQGAISYLAYFLSYVFLTRVLDPIDIGKLPLLNATYAVYQTTTTLCLQFAIVKFVSEFAGSGRIERASDVFWSAIRLVGVASISGFAVVTLFSPQLSELILGSRGDAGLLILTILSDLVSNFGIVLLSVLWGLSSFKKMAASNMAGILLERILGILLAWLGFGLQGYVAGWLIGATATLAPAIVFAGPYLKRRRNPVPAKEMLAYSYPILLVSLVTLAQSWADVTILYALTSNLIDTGVYYLGVAGSGIMLLLSTALTWAIFPTLSAMFGRGETEPFKETLRVSQRLLNMLMMPIGLALAAVAGTAVTVVYGQAYAGATIPFAILTASSILPAYLSLMTYVLQAIKRTQALIRIWSAAALTEIALTVILVPPLNVMGSALARVGMSAVGVLVSYAYLKDSWWPKIERTSLAKNAMLAALVGIVLFLFDSFVTYEMGIGSLGRGVLDMMVFLFVYVAGLIRLRIVLPEDIEKLEAVLPTSFQPWLGRIRHWLIA